MFEFSIGKDMKKVYIYIYIRGGSREGSGTFIFNTYYQEIDV